MDTLSVTNAYLYNIMIYYYYIIIIIIIAFHCISFYYHFNYLQIYVSLVHHHIIRDYFFLFIII